MTDALLVDIGPTKRSASPRSCFGYPEYSDVLLLWKLCVPFASDGDPSYGCTTGVGVFVLFRQIVYLAESKVPQVCCKMRRSTQFFFYSSGTLYKGKRKARICQIYSCNWASLVHFRQALCKISLATAPLTLVGVPHDVLRLLQNLQAIAATLDGAATEIEKDMKGKKKKSTAVEENTDFAIFDRISEFGNFGSCRKVRSRKWASHHPTPTTSGEKEGRSGACQD